MFGYAPLGYKLLGGFLAGVVGLNIFASWRLIRDDGFETSQKWLQAALIWLVPLFVAFLVIAMTNKTLDKPSGRYRNKDDEDLPDFTQIDADNSSGFDAGGAAGGDGGGSGD